MGRIRISSPNSNVSGFAYINVTSPQIKRGWWTDMQDKGISKSLLTDIVRFHVETIGIPDEKKISITIMDSDGMLNPDDEIHKGEIIIRQNKGIFEFKLERSWLKHIDDDRGDAIELYARCEYRNDSVSLPKSSSEYLNVYNVGYLAYNDSRIKICDNGDIEYWPEHFDRLALDQWNIINYPYKQGKVYIDSEGNQYIGGIPTKLGCIVNHNSPLPFNSQKFIQNLIERELCEIENNTPPSPVNYPLTRSQKKAIQKGGGIVKPPVGAKVGASATLVLDIAFMIYDIILPFAVNAENTNINHHKDVLKNVMKDIAKAFKYGIINEELTFQECCQLASVVLYGGNANVSEKVYDIGCDVYEFVSKFEKIKL